MQGYTEMLLFVPQGYGSLAQHDRLIFMCLERYAMMEKSSKLTEIDSGYFPGSVDAIQRD